MTLAAKLGSAVGTGTYVPGQPGGAGGPSGPPAPNAGAGWELKVLAAPDYHTLLARIPAKLLAGSGLQFVKQMDDNQGGSGTVTLNMDDPWWNITLPNAQPASYLLNFEHLWQVWQDGVLRYEFFGEAITEQLADASEQRIVTVTGPGAIAALTWAMAAPPGFPGDIVYKLDALTDSFSEIDGSGNPVLDTGLWNLATPSNRLALNPLGSCQITGSPGTTFLGTSTFDATTTLISAQVTPIVSPDPAGATLDGSQLTQFYIQSTANAGDYMLIGLSAASFYAQYSGPAGSQTHTIASAAQFNAANSNNFGYSYWQISESAGYFYVWTSPDGQNWTQQWKVPHSDWNPTSVAFYVTAKYDVDNTEHATVTGLNSNVTTSSLAGALYFDQPVMAVWLDQLTRAQQRGTIPFVTTGQLSAQADTFGNLWTDSQSVQIQNGTDLLTLLQGHASMIDADYIMQPGFRLQVGTPQAAGAITLGYDRSGQVIFRDGYDAVSRTRHRVRNQIHNLLGVINSDGRTVTADNTTSASTWGQREAWIQAAVQITQTGLAVVADAAAQQNSSEILSYTLTVAPYLPNRTIFTGFDVGDWVGLERPDFSAIDKVRVTAIAVQVQPDGTETHELTLESYIQFLQERLQYIVGKLGGNFISAAGTTAVASNGALTNLNQPTVFAPTLAGLGDVQAGAGSAAPLVYDPVSGLWIPAGSPSPVTGTSVPLTVAGPNGTVTISGAGGSVAVSQPGITPGDVGSAPGTITTTQTPTGYQVHDASGTVRVIVGQQLDGTFTHQDANGTAPGIPDTPTVAGIPTGIIVGWDGLLAGAAPLSDFLWTEIHMSTTSGFTPSSSTLQSTMAAGGTHTISNLTAGTTYYVVLAARNTSRTASTPSAQASAAALAPGSGSKITFASTAPSSPATGDVWADTSNGNELKQWNGTTWVAFQFGAQAVSFTAHSIGGLAVTIGPTSPSGPNNTGDLWYNSVNNYELNQYNGTSWAPFQFGTGAIAAGSVTAALIAANTITAAQIAAGTITAAQIAAATITGTNIAAGTITATNIAAGTITASLLQAGIVVGGIIDGTTVTGTTLQNSSSSPRTSINPDGSVSITNPAGTVIFRIGPDGTMYWYSGVGALLMELQPSGTTLIYAASSGPQGWGFEPPGTPVLIASGSPSNSSTTYTVGVTQATPSLQGNGDGLLLTVYFNASDTVNATAVSDSAGNVYSQVHSVTTNEHLQVWQCENAAGLNVQSTITVTCSAATATVKNIMVAATSGIAPSSALDQLNTSNSAGSASASASLTPADPGELVLFAVADANAGGLPSAVSDGWIRVADLAAAGGACLALYYSSNPASGSSMAPAATIASAAWATSITSWKPPGATTTNNWTVTGAGTTLGETSAWSAQGALALKITSGGASTWGALSPYFPAVPTTLQSISLVLHTPAALSAVSIGFNWYTSGGTLISSSAGDQGTISTAAGETVVLTITGASAPATATHAKFFIQEAHADSSGTVMHVDDVLGTGGLIYSCSPVPGIDEFGNPFDQGVNFTGLSGLTNVFGVEDFYGNQLATIDGSGNVSGQTVSAATDVLLAGQSLNTMLSDAPQGIIASGTITPIWPSTAIGTTETALWEIDAQVVAGRAYRITVSSGIVELTSAPNRTIFTMRYTADGSTPSTSSSILTASATQAFTASAFHETPTLTALYYPSSAGTIRVLVTGYCTGGTFQFNGPSTVTTHIEDLGVASSGASSNSVVAIGGGTTGSSGAQFYTEYFYPSSTWSFYSDLGQRLFQGTMYHGAEPGESGYQFDYIQWGTGSLGNALTTVLGYSSVSVYLRLYNQHTYYSSGMKWGLHYSSTLGGGVGTYSTILNAGGTSIGEGALTEYFLSSAQWSPFATSGNYLVLGPDSSDEHNLSWYGYFYGGGGSDSFMPRLRVQYYH